MISRYDGDKHRIKQKMLYAFLYASIVNCKDKNVLQNTALLQQRQVGICFKVQVITSNLTEARSHGVDESVERHNLGDEGWDSLSSGMNKQVLI